MTAGCWIAGTVGISRVRDTERPAIGLELALPLAIRTTDWTTLDRRRLPVIVFTCNSGIGVAIDREQNRHARTSQNRVFDWLMREQATRPAPGIVAQLSANEGIG